MMDFGCRKIKLIKKRKRGNIAALNIIKMQVRLYNIAAIDLIPIGRQSLAMSLAESLPSTSKKTKATGVKI